MGNLEILPPEEEKKAIDSFLSYIIKRDVIVDKWNGINETIISIPIYSWSDYKPNRYNEETVVSIDVVISNDSVSYRIGGWYNSTLYDYKDIYSGIREDKHHHFKFSELVDRIQIATKNGIVHSFSKPFVIPQELLSDIISEQNAFRHNGERHYFPEGQIVFMDVPSLYVLKVLDYIVKDGNVPDEDIDELYDIIQPEIKKAEKKKQEEADREKKETLNSKESIVKELNLSHTDNLTALISNPSSLREVSDLEQYCKENNLQSKILEKIYQIPSNYDTNRLLHDIYRCMRKEVLFPRIGFYSRIIFWLSVLSFFVVICIGVFSGYPDMIYSNSDLVFFVYATRIDLVIALLSFVLWKYLDHKLVKFNKYTSNFINEIFK